MFGWRSFTSRRIGCPSQSSGCTCLFWSSKAEHCSFYSTSARKTSSAVCSPLGGQIVDVVKKSLGQKTIKNKLVVLEDLTCRCYGCQQIEPAPVCLQVLLETDILSLNETICIDSTYSNHVWVLRIVDAATDISAARFLPDVNTATIWAAFVKCWASAYTGPSNRIRVDWGPCVGCNVYTVAKGAHIDIARSITDAHLSLGIRERIINHYAILSERLNYRWLHTFLTVLFSQYASSRCGTLLDRQVLFQSNLLSRYIHQLVCIKNLDNRSLKFSVESKFGKFCPYQVVKSDASLRVKRARHHKFLQLPQLINGDYVLI